MNNRAKVKDSIRTELKSVSPDWNNPEKFGVPVTNYCIADLYSGEKPVYVTKNGVEIESWELPNLPKAYLDEVCWPANTPMDEVANEGLTMVPNLDGRFLKPLNRAIGNYSQNKMDLAGLTMITAALDGYANTNRPDVPGTNPTAQFSATTIPTGIYLHGAASNNIPGNADSGVTYGNVTSGLVTSVHSSAEARMVNDISPAVTFKTYSTSTSATAALTGAYNKIAYQMGDATGSNTGTWEGAGLAFRGAALANDLVFNYIPFTNNAITKGDNDTLTVTITITIG